MVTSVPQLVPLKGLWLKGKSTLEEVHPEALVAVQEAMQEYVKAFGCGQAHDTAGTAAMGKTRADLLPKGLWPWVRPCWSEQLCGTSLLLGVKPQQSPYEPCQHYICIFLQKSMQQKN